MGLCIHHDELGNRDLIMRVLAELEAVGDVMLTV